MIKIPRYWLTVGYEYRTNSQCISKLSNNELCGVTCLFTFFSRNKVFDGTKRELAEICFDSKNITKDQVEANFKAIFALSMRYFTIPIKNQEGELIYECTRQIIDIEIQNFTDNGLDSRVKIKLLITPHGETLDAFIKQTQTKACLEYVEIKRVNTTKTRACQSISVNTLTGLINYYKKARYNFNSKDLRIDLTEFLSKADLLKAYKKNRTRTMDRLVKNLEIIQKNDIDLDTIYIQNKIVIIGYK